MAFKKFSKSPLDKGAFASEENEAQGKAYEPTLTPYSSLLQRAAAAQVSEPEDSNEEPETVIGENVVIKGSISFPQFLRIDGSFEGEILSQGKIVIGPTGKVKADLTLQEAYISGKVEGNVTVTEKLVLRGRAEVKGDITAPSISVDEGVSIQGQLKVCKSPSSVDESSFEDEKEPTFE